MKTRPSAKAADATNKNAQAKRADKGRMALPRSKNRSRLR
jgi:hypothetical protein